MPWVQALFASARVLQAAHVPQEASCHPGETVLAVTSFGGPQTGQNLKKKNPQFCSEKWPRKTATESWQIFVLLSVSFLNSCVFFPHGCPNLLLFRDILKPRCRHNFGSPLTKCSLDLQLILVSLHHFWRCSVRGRPWLYVWGSFKNPALKAENFGRILDLVKHQNVRAPQNRRR